MRLRNLLKKAAGLFSSVAHLGQPTRAWRAFSQWRSSWLSREGVVASACFLPALLLGWMALQLEPGTSMAATPAVRVLGGVLLLLALATIACTAMIYASLKPIPAWSHPLVLPVYLVFALFSGVYFSIAILPQWMQFVAQFVPGTYILDGIRQGLMQGVPVSDLLYDVWPLLLMAVVLIPAGAYAFSLAERYAKRTGKLKRVG